MAAVRSTSENALNRLAIAAVIVDHIDLPVADLLDRLDGLQAAQPRDDGAADGDVHAGDHAVPEAVHQARAALSAGRQGDLCRRALVGAAHLRQRRARAEGGRRRRSSPPIPTAS